MNSDLITLAAQQEMVRQHYDPGSFTLHEPLLAGTARNTSVYTFDCRATKHGHEVPQPVYIVAWITLGGQAKLFPHRSERDAFVRQLLGTPADPTVSWP